MDLGGEAFELVEGELKPVSIGNRLHAMVCSRINRILGNYGERTGVGYALCNDFGVLVVRDPDTLRGADVAFYGNAKLPEQIAAEDIPTVPPDLVVEVVSPGNTAADLLKKIYEYLNIGVGMVWIVHPVRRTLTIYLVRCRDADRLARRRRDRGLGGIAGLRGENGRLLSLNET